MARINTYALDSELTKGDKWIGTNEGNGNTKNFSVGQIEDYLIDNSTGDIIINFQDDEDIEAVNLRLKFKDRDASGNQKGYKIIRADFDWDTIPASFADSIWEIRLEFDLNASAVTLPDNVFLYFNGGFIKNYTSITGTGTTISTCKPNGFDGVGTLDASFVFDICFTQDDKDLLDSLANVDLSYTPSATTGTVTNTGGTNAVIPTSSATNSGLLVPINTLTEKGSPVSGDLVIIEDSADSNNKKKVQVGNLPGASTNLAYTPSATTGTVTSDTGTDAVIPTSSSTNSGLLVPINTLTEKGSPVSGDLIIIEDSAESNNKKKIQIGNLPAGGGANLGYNASPTDGEVTSDSGTDATLPLATGVNAGLLSPSEKDTISSVLEVIGGPTVFGFTYNSNIVINYVSTLTPRHATLNAICTVANNGYSIGDRVQVSPYAHFYEQPSNTGFTFFLNFSPTAAQIRISSNNMRLASNITTNPISILDTQWDLEVILYGFN